MLPVLTSSPSLTGTHCKSGLAYVQSVHFGGFSDKIAGTAVVIDGRTRSKGRDWQILKLRPVVKLWCSWSFPNVGSVEID